MVKFAQHLRVWYVTDKPLTDSQKEDLCITITDAVDRAVSRYAGHGVESHVGLGRAELPIHLSNVDSVSLANADVSVTPLSHSPRSRSRRLRDRIRAIRGGSL